MKVKTLFALLLYIVPVLGTSSFQPSSIIKNDVSRYIKENVIPGIAVGLYFDGKVYFYNFGYADPKKKRAVTKDTIFEIGSITKSFTATVLAHEIRTKKMKLNDSLGDSISFVKNHSPLQDITLKQLATHTSSLPRKSPIPKPLMTKRRVLKALLKWKPEVPIGSDYCYSNVGYNLLGYALEERGHKSYITLFNDLIIQPLHMETTMLNVPARLKPDYAQGHDKYGAAVSRMENNALGAAGSLKSTSVDMMNFLKANMGDYGPKHLIDDMKFTHQGYVKVDDIMTQGLSWELVHYKGVDLIDKNGGVTGFSTWIGFIPHTKKKKGIGLFLLSNRRNKQLTEFGRTLLRKLSLTT